MQRSNINHNNDIYKLQDHWTTIVEDTYTGANSKSGYKYIDFDFDDYDELLIYIHTPYNTNYHDWSGAPSTIYKSLYTFGDRIQVITNGFTTWANAVSVIINSNKTLQYEMEALDFQGRSRTTGTKMVGRKY